MLLPQSRTKVVAVHAGLSLLLKLSNHIMLLEPESLLNYLNSRLLLVPQTQHIVVVLVVATVVLLN
jgi:hypothetical protein